MRPERCLAITGVALLVLAIMPFDLAGNGNAVRPMQASELLAITGGETCYKDTVGTCGDDTQSCPGHKCHVTTGSSYKCGKEEGDPNGAREVKQVSVPTTYATPTGFTDGEPDENPLSCNQSRLCTCTKDVPKMCVEEEDEEEGWTDCGSEEFYPKHVTEEVCPTE